MEVYFDSSVMLSIIFQQSPRLERWAFWDEAYTSAITRTECRRNIDRARLEGRLSDVTVTNAHWELDVLLREVDKVALSAELLEGAGAPMSTVVKTLDAIHLTTARALRVDVPGLVFATHDRQQAIAARAMGFDILGV